METEGLWSLPRVMSVVLLKVGTAMVSMATVATEGSLNAQGLVSHMGPRWCPGITLLHIFPTAVGREGPAPCLGKTVELALLVT